MNPCWIETASGRRFYPLAPRAVDVCIEDIAHALANQCRFSGHVREFFSVAQHSLLVSKLCPPGDALWGLLHDASEAYLVDLPRPIKHCSELGDFFRTAEGRVMRAVCDAFGLPHAEPPSVKRADNALLLAEKRDLMPGTQDWESTQEKWAIEAQETAASVKIVPLPPRLAEAEFLAQFHYLNDLHQARRLFCEDLTATAE